MSVQVGDVVQRPGPLLTQHKGIFVGWDYLGRPWVIHNAKDDRVRWDLLEDFAAGLPVRAVLLPARAAPERRDILARAKSLLGKPFDLFKFNCEHFVSYALTGVAQSPQLQGFSGLGIVAAVLALL